MRLYLFIKNALDITRSEVTKLQEEKRILVNDKLVSLTTNVLDEDVVKVDGEVLKKEPFVYYLYNKPVGVICTNNKEYKYSIKNYLDTKERVYPIGRLDKQSSGLLILTNDSRFCNDVLSTHYEKEYIVGLENKISDEFIINMPKPIVLNNKLTLPCKVKKIDDYHFSIILNEGMYHQIRRMVRFHGNKVKTLLRIRIGNIKLNDLSDGEYILNNNIPYII